MDYSRLKTKVEQNEARDKEERIANSHRFTELFNSRNETNETLRELTTTIKMLTQNITIQFNALEDKIDELKKGGIK